MRNPQFGLPEDAAQSISATAFPRWSDYNPSRWNLVWEFSSHAFAFCTSIRQYKQARCILEDENGAAGLLFLWVFQDETGRGFNHRSAAEYTHLNYIRLVCSHSFLRGRRHFNHRKPVGLLMMLHHRHGVTIARRGFITLTESLKWTFQQQMNNICVPLLVETVSRCLVLHWHSSPVEDASVEWKDNKLAPNLPKCVWGRCLL